MKKSWHTRSAILIVFAPKEGNDVVFELTIPLVVTYTVNPHEFYIAAKNMKAQSPPR